jgi:hypothetical protein
MRQLPVGSIYLITCNRELKSAETGEEYTVEQFKDKFGTLVPFDIIPQSIPSANSFKTIRKMFTTQIESIMADRVRNEEKVKFIQLFNILYEENRGARMFTFGGVIVDTETQTCNLNINDFPFIRTDEDIYKIDIPNLTFKEEIHISHHIPDKIDVLKKEYIIDNRDIDKYIAIYKFLPNFFDIRI